MEKIRKYIEELFIHAPKTKRSKELQEELISDLEEKYSELIKEGMNEKEAYQEVISGIGDIDELINSFHPTEQTKTEISRNQKRTAIIVSLSVGLYILGCIAVIILEEFKAPEYIGACTFLAIAGVATCLLIYHFVSVPKYQRQDETLVENFKEWKNNKMQNKELRSAISSILWTLTVIIYLIISFAFQIWYISWIIFLIAALVENVIHLIFRLKEYES